jgi:hypothetical protein
MASPNDYTFTPPTATEYQAQIQANGTTLDPSRINATFCVGQQIQFSLNFSPTLTSSNEVCNWTLPANVVSNPTTNNKGCISYNSGGSVATTNSSPCLCWCVNGSGGKVSVGASLIMPNGKSVSIAAIGQFAIYRPTLQNFTNNPAAWVTNFSGYLSLGNGSVGDMSYQTGVFSSYPGSADITQLINRNANSGLITDTTSGQYWLDTVRFYISQTSNPNSVRPISVGINSPLNFSDGPEIALVSSVYNETTTISDEFIDYFVFRPSGASNIYVTLGKTSWSWSGASTYSNGQWTPASGSVSRPAAPDNSADFPQWPQVHNNN